MENKQQYSYSPHEKRACPCKSLPLSLSSFTAAEYGDLHTLMARFADGSVAANRTDAGGYTPLYYAAQHGHVAATCLLLELGASPNGNPACGATPLHRASFAGAVAAIRILLEEKYHCDMLARDTSFGDNMTPLHKAAAGGRYLAVQLLVESLRARTSESRNSDEGTPLEHSLLTRALRCRDSAGRTPYEVAVELARNQETEQRSVQRWDSVAGGSADWGRCVQLLRTAEREQSASDETMSAADQESSEPYHTKSKQMALPAHLTAGAAACLDCGEGEDGSCLTASWESAFRSVLVSSVETSLRKDMPRRSTVASKDKNDTNAVDSNNLAGDCDFDMNDKKAPKTYPPDSTIRLEDNPALLGRGCARCEVVSIALFQEGNDLVCRNCAKASRRKASRSSTQ